LFTTAVYAYGNTEVLKKDGECYKIQKIQKKNEQKKQQQEKDDAR
jgi:hypothetical protein